MTLDQFTQIFKDFPVLGTDITHDNKNVYLHWHIIPDQTSEEIKQRGMTNPVDRKKVDYTCTIPSDLIDAYDLDYLNELGKDTEILYNNYIQRIKSLDKKDKKYKSQTLQASKEYNEELATYKTLIETELSNFQAIQEHVLEQYKDACNKANKQVMLD